MCGFTGFCNLKRKITSKDIIYNMNKCISNRGPDENGYYYECSECGLIRTTEQVNSSASGVLSSCEHELSL